MKVEKETITETSSGPFVAANGTGAEAQTDFRQKLVELFKELDASDLPKLSLDEIEEYLGRKLGGIAEAFPDGIIPRAGAGEISGQSDRTTSHKPQTNGVLPTGAALPTPPNPHGPMFMALAKAIDEAGVPKLTVEEIEAYLGRPLGGIAAAYPDGKR